jgi:hypothetical protein
LDLSIFCLILFFFPLRARGGNAARCLWC